MDKKLLSCRACLADFGREGGLSELVKKRKVRDNDVQMSADVKANISKTIRNKRSGNLSYKFL